MVPKSLKTMTLGLLGEYLVSGIVGCCPETNSASRASVRNRCLSFTIHPVKLKSAFILIALTGLAGTLLAQQPGQQPAQPQIQVNYLNVCVPPDAEKAEILAALDHLPLTPRFSSDFEIARGRTTTTDNSVAVGAEAKPSTPELSRWIRIRKEFAEGSPYLNAQYTFSLTGDKAEELLVLRIRDPKDVMQVSISDEVEALANPAQIASVRTPADRIRLERFGKSSLVLARCKGADQSAYEPLFRKASEVLNAYRGHLDAHAVVAQDLPKTAERSAPAGHSKPKRNP